MEDLGGRAFKIQGSDESFQEVGIPDLLVCYRGRFVGIEVKLPGEQPSPIQTVVIREINAAGGYATVCETVEQAAHLLSTIDREVDVAEGNRVPLSRAAVDAAKGRSRKRLRH